MCLLEKKAESFNANFADRAVSLRDASTTSSNCGESVDTNRACQYACIPAPYISKVLALPMLLELDSASADAALCGERF